MTRGEGHDIRQPDSRSGSVCGGSDNGKKLFERDVALAEDVAFADVSILLSDPLWVVELYTKGGWARLFRWFVNGLSIFANTNVFLTWPVGRYPGQLTALARRPGFPITRTDGSGGIHHHCREAVSSGIHHFVFCHELRSLVMADHLIEASFGPLIGQSTACRHCDGSYTARVYKFLDACLP